MRRRATPGGTRGGNVSPLLRSWNGGTLERSAVKTEPEAIVPVSSSGTNKFYDEWIAPGMTGIPLLGLTRFDDLGASAFGGS